MAHSQTLVRTAALLALATFVVLGNPTVATAQPNFIDVIVVLDPGIAPGGHAQNERAAEQAARGLGVTPDRVYGTVLFGFSARIPEARLNGLERNPRVAYVTPDQADPVPTATPDAPPCHRNPNHPACGGEEPPDDGGSGDFIPWGINRTGAFDNIGNEGMNVDVYIIDTGIDSNHPDLSVSNNSYAVVNCVGKKRTCKKDWDDDQGHGTHVAGTSAGLSNGSGVLGVASQATLHAVKVCGSNLCWRSDIIDGIDWVANQVAAAQKPAVANVSIGGDGNKTGTCTAGGFVGTDAYHEAYCNAARVGVVFAVSAGNEGIDVTLNQPFGKVPADYTDAAMAVSATKCSVVANGVIESCNGGEDWPNWSNHGSAVAIAAPGDNILSTYPGGGTARMSGTSMASPHVAGAAALYLAASPGQADDYSAFLNTKAALQHSAEDTGPGSGWSNTSGNTHNEQFLSVDPTPALP